MRKAKIILGAVAVLGIVGAAFAFKTRTTQFVYVPTTTTNTTLCPLTSYGLTTTNIQEPLSFTISGTAIAGRPCGVITVKTTD